MPVIFILLLSSIFHAQADIKSEMFLLGGCYLYTVDGTKFATFPGDYCEFLPDGSFVSADSQSIRRFGKNKEVLWKIPGMFHHQLNMSADRKRALALSTTIHTEGTKHVRTDNFLVIDVVNGKVLHEVQADKLLEGKVEFLDFPLGVSNKYAEQVDYETTHFNSIYEIGELKTKSKHSFIKTGNIVVNSLKLGMFILSPDLKTVLHSQTFDVSENHQVHDVQVLPDGNILFFNNDHIQGKDLPHSAINIVTPVTNKVLYEFTATPKSMFYSPVAGGVQPLGEDRFLFSGVLRGTFIVERNSKKLVYFKPSTHMDRDRPVPRQDIKMVWLWDFLKFWNGQ